MKCSSLLVAGALGALALQPAPSQALEVVKVATTALGLWDSTQPTFCKDRGEFEKAGLDVEVISTRGGSENVQAVVAGGMDIGYSPGLNSVLAAYTHGAKIVVLSSQSVGSDDNFYYVPADSPIKSIADIAGKSVAFSRPGGAAEAVLLALKTERKMDFKTVATGAMDATYTMTMTRQVDVGYAIPPSMLGAIADGKIRQLFSGADVNSIKGLSGRVIIGSADFVKKRRDVARKFFEVLDQCIDWAYANPTESVATYAKLNKIEPAVAEKAMVFYHREKLRFGALKGFETLQQQAVDAKFIDKPLTPAQTSELIDIIYSSKE